VVPVDVSLVRRLLAAQFPQWTDLPVVPADRFGTDNAMFRLGRDLAVRLPRFAHLAAQVDREQAWLPRLAPHLPLRVPVPLARGEPAEGYPFRWSVCPWFAGESPDIGNSDRAAPDLAAFVSALRGLDADGGPPPEASNSYRGVPLGDGRPSVAEDSAVRARIAALDGLVDTRALTAVWDAALAAPAWDGRPVWIHGDLTPGNLLAVDGRLHAVIDFGCLGVGDPACDLMAAWTCLRSRGRAVFRAALGVDDATWARGRGWGLAMTLPAPADVDRARPLVEELTAEGRCL
jgi:aminoglycoside phosphotransferase (APT) family kinase protein